METPRTLIRALATNSPATPDGVPLETVEDNDLIFPACSKTPAVYPYDPVLSPLEHWNRNH